MQFDSSFGFGEIALAGSILVWFYQKVPAKYRAFKRQNRLAHCRSLRTNRDNIPFINNVSTGANVNFGFFLLTTVLFLALVYGVPSVQNVLEKSIGYAFLFAFPIFIFEFLWLQQSQQSTALIRAHGRLIRYRRFQR